MSGEAPPGKEDGMVDTIGDIDELEMKEIPIDSDKETTPMTKESSRTKVNYMTNKNTDIYTKINLSLSSFTGWRKHERNVKEC